MKKFDLELAVGLFVVAGIICLGYLSIKLGRMEILGSKGYDIEAIFSDSGGLKTGSIVSIAGVEVGRVKHVILDDYQARVTINLPLDVTIQEDAIASIKTKGLVGDKYIFDFKHFNGTNIREMICDNKPIQGLVPISVIYYLKEIEGIKRVKNLSQIT